MRLSWRHLTRSHLGGMTIRTMLNEAMWERLAPLLPSQKPWTGRPSLDHRRFLEAVLWLARTGAPWRDLPPS